MNWKFQLSGRGGWSLISQSRSACRGYFALLQIASDTFVNKCQIFGPHRIALPVLSSLYLMLHMSVGWSQGLGAAIDIGEAKLYPSVTLSYISNDNIFATREALVESNGVKVEPGLLYVAGKGGNGIELGYAGSYLKTDVSEADYADHRLLFKGLANISSRSQLRSEITFDAGHFDFGSSYLSRGEVSRNLDEPYKYNEFRFNTLYRYGAERAKGNAILGLSARNRSYTNEPDTDNPTRTDGLNFSSVVPYLIFSIRASGDTRVFLDLRFGANDYDAFANNSTAELDNNRIRAYIGSSWDITGRTGGSIKVGSIITNFDDSRRSDDETLGFELDAFYSLKEYSKITVGLTREQDTVTDNELLGRRDVLDLNWRHEWSTKFNSGIGVQYRTTFSSCEDEPGVAGRENNDLSFSGEFNYKFRRWFSVGVGYKFDNGESSICVGDGADNREFERNQIDAHINLTL